jgi:hypothetical protein
MINDIKRVPYHHVREIEDTRFDECSNSFGKITISRIEDDPLCLQRSANPHEFMSHACRNQKTITSISDLSTESNIQDVLFLASSIST